jgi:hypothetical protein
MPVACIWEYTIVEPTNLNPLFFKSLLIRSDSSVFAGISFRDSNLLWIGLLPVNFHMYVLKVPNSFLTSIKAFAFVTALSIFNLFRIIPLSCSREFIFRGPYVATLLKSNVSKAFRKFSLFFKIVSQLNPA